MPNDNLENLRRFAHRVENDPLFLAAWLARHRAATGLCWDQQAQLLGVTGDVLISIALCRAPRPGRQGRDDVHEICQQFGGNVQELLSICDVDGYERYTQERETQPDYPNLDDVAKARENWRRLSGE